MHHTVSAAPYCLLNPQSQTPHSQGRSIRASRRERILYCQPTGPNPLHHLDDFGRPALRHGSSNSLFQVALYLPVSSNRASRKKCSRKKLLRPLGCSSGRVRPLIALSSSPNRYTILSHQSRNLNPGLYSQGFKLPWREAGPLHHHHDKVDSDQLVVNKDTSLYPQD